MQTLMNPEDKWLLEPLTLLITVVASTLGLTFISLNPLGLGIGIFILLMLACFILLCVAAFASLVAFVFELLNRKSEYMDITLRAIYFLDLTVYSYFWVNWYLQWLHNELNAIRFMP